MMINIFPEFSPRLWISRFDCSEIESNDYKSQLRDFRQILRLSGGSNPDESVLEIPPSQTDILAIERSQNASIKEVIFSSDSSVTKIQGFGRFQALTRVHIPPSLEEITDNAFHGCCSLTEVIFPLDSRLKADWCIWSLLRSPSN
jgi:hypothetical protein